MRRAWTALLALALLAATAAAMANAAALGLSCRSVSARYRQPLDGAAAAKAREQTPGLTFWGEGEAVLETGLRAMTEKCIYFTGDTSLIWPMDCALGALPGPFETAGCALSAGLAHDLFGSEAVVGLSLKAGEKQYTVCGVFQGEEPLALLFEKDFAFTAVELVYDGQLRQDPEGQARQRLAEAGLPAPDWLLLTGEPAFLARGMAWLPLLFALPPLALAAKRRVGRLPAPAGEALLFLLLAALALALPAALAALPGWLTPSRWSDFGWWGRLAESLSGHFTAWLSAPAAGRDLAIKTGFARQLALAAAQCALAEALRCRLRAAAVRCR